MLAATRTVSRCPRKETWQEVCMETLIGRAVWSLSIPASSLIWGDLALSVQAEPHSGLSKPPASGYCSLQEGFEEAAGPAFSKQTWCGSLQGRFRIPHHPSVTRFLG